MAPPEISERHRHRYEFNREYEQVLTEGGLRVAGQTPDGVYVEICEIPDHPWFLGCQFHPEFKSKPLEPHPLFSAFIGAALQAPQERVPRPDSARRSEQFIARRLSTLPPIGRGQPLVLIAGPCVIESEEHVHFWRRKSGKSLVRSSSKPLSIRPTAAALRPTADPVSRRALRILEGLRNEGYTILTDIHEPAQAELAAEAADILQIPAFLCRQTDLLIAAGRTGRVVNIKKGQFVSPYEIRNAADKVASTGNNNILLTERGSSFGYNNLVVDMRGLAIMREFGWPVIFDATHSVQIPGGLGHASGGEPEFIPTLSRAAVAAGVDGFFVEVHEAPERALSDGANALRLDLLSALWENLQAIHRLAP